MVASTCHGTHPRAPASTRALARPLLTPTPPPFSSPPQAAGARWFCWIDPITYAFRSLIPQQFYCASDGYGAACATVGQITTAGVINVDRYLYVSTKYDVSFSDQWNSLGYLAIFIIVFQLFAFRSTRVVRHIVR